MIIHDMIYFIILAGQFGESFRFGTIVGDMEAQPIFDNSVFVPLGSNSTFVFYERSQNFLFVSIIFRRPIRYSEIMLFL